ncbi:MAG: metallophosphoesterase [Bacteroidetes bacterium CG_4_10_14_3_um_filter_31_20]|nr:metallophosphoesterase [Bacteroidota bacterium]PIX32503.1 MAG: metallophosphoesterase [Bacteroidetes bacterium CG_4_8_14_3_um_filter_31_14]PIY04468.1 MAG: metallophosphoesterase [Bacteroidetes bacterium CG_4_10_14_3_um_filter_31_20]
MRMMLPFGITIAIYLLTELLFIFGVKSLLNNRICKLFYWINSIITVVLIVTITIFYIKIRSNGNFISYTNMFYGITYFMLLLVTKLVFVTFFIINQILKYVIRFVIRGKNKFIIVTYIGLVFSILTFITITYGMFIGKNDFTIRNEKISSSKIPQSFDKFKIVQISDIHIGSFYYNSDKLISVVNTINKLNPDIVIFTGDLVNNFAEEADGYDTCFANIKAKYGKYAILGNHDFGDYSVWRTPETKQVNLEKIISHYNAMGFKLLRNSSEIISNGKDSITIVGVDNWGLPPFKQYGDLKKALKNVSLNLFTIMLSHDPTHWDKEIKFYKNIDITFSGHTHGMQMGFEKFGIKWSPVQYRYKQWAGLYQNNNNYLYVNRGLGCIGFLGRIGMPPEITLIEIYKK